MRLALVPTLLLALSSCSSESLDSEPSDPPGGGSAGSPNAGGGPSGAGGATGGRSTTGGATSTGGGAASADLLQRVFGPESDAPLTVTTLFKPASKLSATALAFDPLRAGELWVVLRQFPVDAPCTADVSTGCRALPGRIALIQGATGDAPTTVVKDDGNAWHFMRRPSAIAFGDNGNLATCGEYRTGNYDDDAVDYMGPTLWSSDPTIFGVEPLEGQNGTHLDMLHNTPFGMGIAHERDNVYWLFNGQIGALDRYDFHEPHVIGGEDHSDGEMERYVEGELLRVAELPSHLALDKSSRLLYVVDSGHRRVVRLDIDSGTENGDVPTYDPIVKHARMDGAALEEFVPPGTLERPSGIALGGGIAFVSDNATNRIYAFDGAGKLLRAANVELPEQSLGGITLGPDQRLYLADLKSGAGYRLNAAE